MLSDSAGAGISSIMNKTLIITLITASALCAGSGFAKDEEMKTGGMNAAFIPKAANGGRTEVELGKLAAEKGASQEGRTLAIEWSRTIRRRMMNSGKSPAK